MAIREYKANAKNLMVELTHQEAVIALVCVSNYNLIKRKSAQSITARKLQKACWKHGVDFKKYTDVI